MDGDKTMKTTIQHPSHISILFDPERVVTLFREGKRIQEIATICDRNPNVVSAILTARGIGIRTRRVKVDGNRRIEIRGDEPEPYVIVEGKVAIYDQRKATMKRVDAAPAIDAAAGKLSKVAAARIMGISATTLNKIIVRNEMGVTKCNRGK